MGVLWNIRGIVSLSVPLVRFFDLVLIPSIVIFGKPAQFCLDQRECYCQTYGYCDMTDTDIQKQWVWRGLRLPEKWPEQTETAK